MLHFNPAVMNKYSISVICCNKYGVYSYLYMWDVVPINARE